MSHIWSRSIPTPIDIYDVHKVFSYLSLVTLGKGYIWYRYIGIYIQYCNVFYSTLYKHRVYEYPYLCLLLYPQHRPATLSLYSWRHTPKEYRNGYKIYFMLMFVMGKRKRSDSVLWQKPLHQQKCQKGKVTTQTIPQKSLITQRLRNDLGWSAGVTTATQLVWLTWFTGPTFPLHATAK